MIEEVALHMGKDGKETKDLADVQKKNFHKQQKRQWTRAILKLLKLRLG